MVRKRAIEAIVSIHKEEAARKARVSPPKKRVAAKAGFGNAPRKLAPRPTLYLVLKSTRDESGGRLSKKMRKRREAKLRGFMQSELKAAPDVTTSEGLARRYGIEKNALDASITKLRRRVNGRYVEVECEIRIAISNDRGKMLSFLTGGAKVQVPKQTFRKKHLPRLRVEAIENAVKSVHQDLLTHLRPRRRG
jgi:hypothetical protein